MGDDLLTDVLFVVPAVTRGEEFQGTLILATVLKQHGISVDIHRFYEVDMSDYHLFVEKTVEKILERSPRAVSFYCRCDYYLADIKIAERIKEKRPDIYIVFGGPQADAGAVETLKELPWIDYCCCGEGETTVYPFFSALLSGGDPRGVDGLCYRNEKNEVVCNPRPKVLENLDDVPMVDYSLIKPDIMRLFSEDGSWAFPLDSGRGCPFACTFCSTKLFWQRKFRLKSDERILLEMEDLYRNYGVRVFGFMHDMFTLKKENVLSFCRKLRASGMEASWYCSSRADTLDEEMIAEMARSYAKGISVGIETGSQRMQKLIKKNLDLEKSFETLRLIHKYGLELQVYFMYGFPGETELDLSHTMDYFFRVCELDKNVESGFFLCSFLQGSEMFEKYFGELTFTPLRSYIVGDFGVKEELDFICEHKSVFPHYYGYMTEFILSLEYFEPFMRICKSGLDYYKLLTHRYEKDRKLDMYYDFENANKEYFSKTPDKKDVSKNRDELMDRFAQRILSDSEYSVFSEIKRFCVEKARFSASEETDSIGYFNADVSAFLHGSELSDIKSEKHLVVMAREDASEIVVSVY